MKKIILGLAFIANGLLAGCASVPLAPEAQDKAAKEFIAPTDKAALYIYRDESFGAAIKMAISVDDKLIGQTASKTYFYKQVTPGVHKIQSVTENTSSVDVNTEAGKIYYVWQEVKMGFASAGSKLHIVDKEKGQKGVQKSKLIKEQ